MRTRLPSKNTYGVALPALALVIACFASAHAQQSSAPPPPAAKPLVPLATNTVAANPDAYYGESVTLTAAVNQILSKSAFSVVQQKIGAGNKPQANGTDLLVIAPTLNTAVDLNSYVTVMGELVKFDPDVISRKAKDYKLDLTPEMIAKMAQTGVFYHGLSILGGGSILAGVVLLDRFHWMTYLLGAFLIYTAIKLATRVISQANACATMSKCDLRTSGNCTSFFELITSAPAQLAA